MAISEDRLIVKRSEFNAQGYALGVLLVACACCGRRELIQEQGEVVGIASNLQESYQYWE